MTNKLLEAVKNMFDQKDIVTEYAPVSSVAVMSVQETLGFVLPAILVDFYTHLGNGGFGPGYGFMGLKGGYQSDYGDIVETYNQLKLDQESEGEVWPSNIIPFCEWGCNIFSCVDVESLEIYTFEDFSLNLQEYSLYEFIEMWVDGVEILDVGRKKYRELSIEIINPFTGDKSRVYKSQKI